MREVLSGCNIIGHGLFGSMQSNSAPSTNYDNIEMEGIGSLTLPNSLKAPLERVELLGNSVQGENPAPDNPQEIKSAGRKSKNLLDLQKQPDVKETYLGWKVSDGRNVVLSVKDKGNNADITGCYLGLSRTGGSADGVVWVVNNGSVAVKEVVSKNQYVSVFPSNETIVRKLLERFDIQVEYGNNATDYEPYGYFLDVKITGKNLFDINNYVGSINKISESEFHTEAKWGTIIGDINLKAGKKYNISYTFEIDSITNLDCGIRIKCTKSDGTVSYIFNLHRMTGYVCNYTKSAVIPVGTVKCEILLYTDVKLKIGGTFKKLMIAEENENVALNMYEPYTEQTVQIALDEPLRGIGEYKDTITKDGVVRKIKRIVFDGSEDEKWGIAIEKENVINFVSTQFSDAIKINEHQRSMMDKLKWSSGVWGRDEVGQDMFARILRMNMPKTLTPDLQTFKTWLSQNPLTVDYVLAELVTEPLPESVQQQLQALHSENGTTHVFVDSGEVKAGIKLTYRKEK